MDCSRVKQELSALLDGELSAETRAAVESHLAGCAECRREFDELTAVDAAYRELPAQCAPRNFEEQVSMRIRIRRDDDRPRRGKVIQFRRDRMPHKRLWPLLISAAMVAIVLGATIVRMGALSKRLQMAAEPSAGITEQRQEGERVYKIEQFGVEKSAAPPSPDIDRAEAQPHLAPSPPPPAPQEQLKSLGYVSDAAGAKEEAAPMPAPAAPAAVPPAPEPGIEDMAKGAAVVESSPAPAKPVAVELKEGVETAPPPPEQPKSVEAESAQEKDVIPDTKTQLSDAKTLPPAPNPAPVPHVLSPSSVGSSSGSASPPPPSVKLKAPSPPAPMVVSEPAPQAAPAAPPSPPASRGAGVQAIIAPIAAQPEATDEAAKAEAPAVREVAGRRYELHDGVWQDSEHKGEPAKTLKRDSRRARKLIEQHPWLKDVLALGNQVVFQADGKWYKISE